MNNSIIEKGYTVIYDKTNGAIGFIGIDDHSGGYPFFSDRIDVRNVTREIGPAFHLKRSVRNMKSHYGNEKVRFDSVRVVKMSQVFTEVNEDEDKIFLDETMKKLTKDELEVLTRYLAGGAK